MNDQDRQLQELQRENEQLRQQLAERPKIDEDIVSYRIFLDARKKLLGWSAGALVLVTAFGLFSVKEVVQTIREKVEKRGVDTILTEVTEDLKNQVESDVREQLQATLTRQVSGVMPEMVARVESSVKEQLSRSVQIPPGGHSGVADESESKQPAVDQPGSSGDGGSPTNIAQGTYYVIAGSSPRKRELDSELERVQKRVGGSFESMFPSAAIYEPLGNNINYALVVGANLRYEDALELKNRAIENGFRSDTFLWNSKTVSFGRKNE